MNDKTEILKVFTDFVGIQSVSTDSKRRKEIFKAADFLKKNLDNLGFKTNFIRIEDSPPLIIAARLISSGAKTIGIYGHYDVQPEDPVDEWNTPSFQLTLKNGKFFGRGVADNKGHIVQNLTSIKHLIEVDRLVNNIIFILEGEEETGNVHFEEYVGQAKDILSAVDVFYLTDVGMFKKNIPQIFYALRGLVYFELTVEIGTRDLHSGLYGNLVLNPGQILAELFSKMKESETGKVLVPRFYTRVRTIPEKERQLLSVVARTSEEQRKGASVYRLMSLDKRQPYLSAKIYPSLDINGMVSGYVGEGQKTIIPNKAMVKFSCRLVEYQSPDEIEKLIKTFIKKNLPSGVKYNLQVLSKDAPFYMNIDDLYVKKTADILEKNFGNSTVFNRTGGSIPAAEILQRRFGKSIVLTGFTLPDDKIHSPNENFAEEMFWKGIKILEKIYSQ